VLERPPGIPIDGRGGSDLIDGGAGNDNNYGGDGIGQDTLIGGGGDSISGDVGNDSSYGNSTLNGGDGDDTIDYDNSTYAVVGGKGKTVFIDSNSVIDDGDRVDVLDSIKLDT
jgi:hypothetical protein